jgi:hypothetical protein
MMIFIRTIQVLQMNHHSIAHIQFQIILKILNEILTLAVNLILMKNWQNKIENFLKEDNQVKSKLKKATRLMLLNMINFLDLQLNRLKFINEDLMKKNEKNEENLLVSRRLRKQEREALEQLTQERSRMKRRRSELETLIIQLEVNISQSNGTARDNYLFKSEQTHYEKDSVDRELKRNKAELTELKNQLQLMELNEEQHMMKQKETGDLHH